MDQESAAPPGLIISWGRADLARTTGRTTTPVGSDSRPVLEVSVAPSSPLTAHPKAAALPSTASSVSEVASSSPRPARRASTAQAQVRKQPAIWLWSAAHPLSACYRPRAVAMLYGAGRKRARTRTAGLCQKDTHSSLLLHKNDAGQLNRKPSGRDEERRSPVKDSLSPLASGAPVPVPMLRPRGGKRSQKEGCQNIDSKSNTIADVENELHSLVAQRPCTTGSSIRAGSPLGDGRGQEPDKRSAHHQAQTRPIGGQIPSGRVIDSTHGQVTDTLHVRRPKTAASSSTSSPEAAQRIRQREALREWRREKEEAVALEVATKERKAKEEATAWAERVRACRTKLLTLRRQPAADAGPRTPRQDKNEEITLRRPQTAATSTERIFKGASIRAGTEAGNVWGSRPRTAASTTLCKSGRLWSQGGVTASKKTEISAAREQEERQRQREAVQQWRKEKQEAAAREAAAKEQKLKEEAEAWAMRVRACHLRRSHFLLLKAQSQDQDASTGAQKPPGAPAESRVCIQRTRATHAMLREKFEEDLTARADVAIPEPDQLRAAPAESKSSSSARRAETQCQFREGGGDGTAWDRRFMQQAHDSRAVNDEWYISYQDSPELQEFLGSVLNKDALICQVGCGNSRMAPALFQDGYRFLVNVDISRVAVGQMQRRYHGTHDGMIFLAGDATSLPWPSEIIDVFIDKGTLQSLLLLCDGVARVAQFAREMWRLLCPGGKMIQIMAGKGMQSYLNLPDLPWTIRHKVIPRKGPGGVAHVYIFTKPCQARHGVQEPDHDREPDARQEQSPPHTSSSSTTSGAAGVGGGSITDNAAAQEDEAMVLAAVLNGA